MPTTIPGRSPNITITNLPDTVTLVVHVEESVPGARILSTTNLDGTAAPCPFTVTVKNHTDKYSSFPNPLSFVLRPSVSFEGLPCLYHIQDPGQYTIALNDDIPDAMFTYTSPAGKITTSRTMQLSNTVRTIVAMEW